MGTYYYSLRTKNRRMVVGGDKHAVHTVEFAYKHEPKHYRLTEARQERAWECRNPPEYIAWGGFEDGNQVYRGWPVGVVTASEYITDSLEFVGVLVPNGKGGLMVQEWTSIDVGAPDVPRPDNYPKIKQLADMGLNTDGFRVYTRKGRDGAPNRVVACFRDPKDAVIGKVVLA